MDRFGPGLPDRIHDLVDHNVGLVGLRRSDMHRFVRHSHMQGVAVGIGIDGHRLDAHPLCRLDDATGDLAPVRDQDFLEHGPSPSGLMPD